jgi:hypothetical protein
MGILMPNPTSSTAFGSVTKWVVIAIVLLTTTIDDARGQNSPEDMEPSRDFSFLIHIERTRAQEIDRTEEQRRVVIQAQALIEAGRIVDAFDAYNEEFFFSPDWALGRYNAALICARGEAYPCAISEMRRYLYLAPDAPNAREAQDQIYRWEAMVRTQTPVQR